MAGKCGLMGSSPMVDPATHAASLDLGLPVVEAAEAARQAILEEVDAKVTAKVEELWQKGMQMMGQAQQKQQERSEKLGQEIEGMLEKGRALEVENEQLKQVLSNLVNRFSLLGVAFGGTQTPHAGGSDWAACATASPAPSATTAGGSSATSASGVPSLDLFTPVHGTGSGSDAFGSLPEVPPFPFPAPTPTTPAPFSLAEALGTPTPTPQPTPLSLASSLPLGRDATPNYGMCNGSGTIFSFTLRKADETDLGLNVSHHEHEQVLCVEGVMPDGAVDAWNRQCMGSALLEKAVLPGDRIISVNNVAYDPDKMLEECKEKRLLRLVIVRGECPLPDMSACNGNISASNTNGVCTASSPLGSSKLTSLRACATEFVPMAQAAAAATAAADIVDGSTVMGA